MASLFNLCDDVIKFEIFSRTSHETFNSMRCVNKEFDSLSYNPFLQSLRKKNTIQYSGFLMEKIDSPLRRIHHNYASTRGTPLLRIDFLPDPSRILCCSETGLVVFEWFRPHTDQVIRYHVAKPVTSQMVAIPNPMTSFPTVNMAILTLSTTPYRYKILRISACKLMKTRGCDVLSPLRVELFDSLSWVWKEFEWMLMDYGVHSLTKQPIVVSGTVHVLFSDMSIFAFNMYSEHISSIVPPLPIGVQLGYQQKGAQIFKMNRTLGFARMSAYNMWTIWALQRGVRWTAVHQLVDAPCLCRNYFELGASNIQLRLTYNEYLFFKENNIDARVPELGYTLFIFKSDNEPIMLHRQD